MAVRKPWRGRGSTLPLLRWRRAQGVYTPTVYLSLFHERLLFSWWERGVRFQVLGQVEILVFCIDWLKEQVEKEKEFHEMTTRKSTLNCFSPGRPKPHVCVSQLTHVGRVSPVSPRSGWYISTIYLCETFCMCLRDVYLKLIMWKDTGESAYFFDFFTPTVALTPPHTYTTPSNKRHTWCKSA